MSPPMLRQSGKKEKARDWFVSSLISPLCDEALASEDGVGAEDGHDGFEYSYIAVHSSNQSAGDD